ncbi:hypothetical protein Adt_25106 [Abeliophyllum distichum]|uniref:Uncharacterized protein n=1 Tax=Abeliophyllum distichum TaxID=126358 RepID=A0ABD1SFW3_9LAMI
MLPTENGCTVRWSIPAVSANGWSIPVTKWVHNLRRSHRLKTHRAQCDHRSKKGTPSITPGNGTPPNPTQNRPIVPKNEEEKAMGKKRQLQQSAHCEDSEERNGSLKSGRGCAAAVGEVISSGGGRGGPAAAVGGAALGQNRFGGEIEDERVREVHCGLMLSNFLFFFINKLTADMDGPCQPWAEYHLPERDS